MIRVLILDILLNISLYDIFNDFELPQGNYKLQIDFLRQIKSTPYYTSEFDLLWSDVVKYKDRIRNDR